LINKIDTVKNKRSLLLLGEAFRAALGETMAAMVPISAMRKKNLGTAVEELAKALPLGEHAFGEDEITDQPERAIVAEFIREKVMLETKEELPYATAVSIDAFEDERPRLVRIMATIHVEKSSQKGIVIGRGGERLKAIGTRARKDIEHMLESKVFLELHVRVTEDWSTTRRGLAMLGYTTEAEEQGG
jgi:GTP-binding protein Era